jgi:pimeloyl-ACP methyl ester carboxylesterase
MSSEVQFAEIAWDGQAVRIEYAWVGHFDRLRTGEGTPTLVFLHEGLGSRAMWRDFPGKLANALGMRGLVYSRPGYGKSTPRTPGERWQPDFMHRQAHEVLPALLDQLQVREPAWLYGHSDGGSIALLFAARHPERTAGVIVAAPHIFVEDLSVESIEETREVYETTDLRDKLARYHDDVDSAFWGWNDIWLDPRFGAWNIEQEIGAITAPVLAIQGVDDEYGTLAQVEGIARRLGRCELLELEACGHSPHRDQPGAVIGAAVEFARRTREGP